MQSLHLQPCTVQSKAKLWALHPRSSQIHFKPQSPQTLEYIFQPKVFPSCQVNGYPGTGRDILELSASPLLVSPEAQQTCCPDCTATVYNQPSALSV